jgi:hypothetical protein
MLTLQKNMIVKNKYLLITILLLFSACQNKTGKETEQKINIMAAPINDTEIKLDSMGYPIVTKKFEIFDFETYEQRPPAKPNGYRNSTYVLKLPNEIVKVFRIRGGSNGFYYNIYYPNSYFCVFKEYYSNGNIKRKGTMCVQEGFAKGIWYEFDEFGKLIEETDYDKPFEFTFEDVVEFCKKNDIRVEKGYESVEEYRRTGSTQIWREYFESSCQWKIEYRKEDPKAQQGLVEITIRLDGKTGKVISKTQMEYLIQE